MQTPGTVWHISATRTDAVFSCWLAACGGGGRKEREVTQSEEFSFKKKKPEKGQTGILSESASSHCGESIAIAPTN